MRTIDPSTFLLIAGAICAAAFLVGMRFYKRAEELSSSMKTSEAMVRRFGVVMMIVASLTFVFFCLLMSGALGPLSPEQLEIHI